MRERRARTGLKGSRYTKYSLRQRIDARTVVMPSGCHELQGYSYRKYGFILTDEEPRRTVRAHRAAWELVHGPIGPGLVVCHKCDNPICINVEHLFVGTQADNMADLRWKRFQRKMGWAA